MMRARGYVRYHWDRDMKRETGKRERRRRISHRKVPSVVLFQVCIRFVFQPIILTKSSALPLFLSAQNARASKKKYSRPKKHSCPKRFPRDIKGDLHRARGEEN